MGQYNAWTLGGEAVDPGDFSKNWEEFNIYVSSFYRNKEANDYFKVFIKEIVTRKNKFNDRYYFDDPTIMSWQLANEPRPGNGEDGVKHLKHYYQWIDETAEYIHSLDPNHLVSSGNEGIMGSLGSGQKIGDGLMLQKLRKPMVILKKKQSLILIDIWNLQEY
jgi:mannan endo-1,4-beta-mannosidase